MVYNTFRIPLLTIRGNKTLSTVLFYRRREQVMSTLIFYKKYVPTNLEVYILGTYIFYLIYKFHNFLLILGQLVRRRLVL